MLLISNSLFFPRFQTAFKTLEITLKISKFAEEPTTSMWIIAELGGRRPPSGAPYPYKGTKGNPWIDFLMCIMASGIARGRVRTTTTTTTVESRNMAAILQLMG